MQSSYGKTEVFEALLRNLWQNSELISIAPEQIEISRRSVSEMDACERTAAAEYKRRIYARERIQDSYLKLVEPTA